VEDHGAIELYRFERGQHTVLLHDAQEFDDHFGAWSDQDLTLSGFLGVVDVFQRIIED
jgi:hypothetical protein